MEKIPKFNKRRAFNKAVGPGKKSKINKSRAYVYSGLYSTNVLLFPPLNNIAFIHRYIL